MIDKKAFNYWDAHQKMSPSLPLNKEKIKIILEGQIKKQKKQIRTTLFLDALTAVLIGGLVVVALAHFDQLNLKNSLFLGSLLLVLMGHSWFTIKSIERKTNTDAKNAILGLVKKYQVYFSFYKVMVPLTCSAFLLSNFPLIESFIENKYSVYATLLAVVFIIAVTALCFGLALLSIKFMFQKNVQNLKSLEKSLATLEEDVLPIAPATS